MKPRNYTTFPEAIKAVIDGKKITKQEWDDPEYYGLLNGEFLMLHKPYGTFHQWIVSYGDLTGDDWYVITI